MIKVGTSLYRHYDSDGVLLYIGISLCVFNRTLAHERVSKWAKSISTIKITRYRTRREALEAEKIAIKQENPAFNKTVWPIGDRDRRAEVRKSRIAIFRRIRRTQFSTENGGIDVKRSAEYIRKIRRRLMLTIFDVSSFYKEGHLYYARETGKAWSDSTYSLIIEAIGKAIESH